MSRVRVSSPMELDVAQSVTYELVRTLGFVSELHGAYAIKENFKQLGLDTSILRQTVDMDFTVRLQGCSMEDILDTIVRYMLQFNQDNLGVASDFGFVYDDIESRVNKFGNGRRGRIFSRLYC